MRKVLLFLLCFIVSLNVFGQELKLVKELYHKGAIAAAECPKDNYGNFCAAIDIVIPNVKFDVNCDYILKDQTTDIVNGKRVYIIPTSTNKQVRIDAYGFLPITFDVENLSGKELYEIIYSGLDESVSRTGDILHIETKSDTEKMLTNVRETFEEGLDYFESYEWEKAFPILSYWAEKSNSKAQQIIGDYYYNGWVVDKNYEEAYDWYIKSANQGNAESQNKIGDYYYYGDVVPKDLYKAFQWYLKSAGQGNVDALNNVGACYYTGEGVTQDFPKAVYWFKRAAGKGNKQSCKNLGNCYKYGLGVPIDMNLSSYWFEKAE